MRGGMFGRRIRCRRTVSVIERVDGIEDIARDTRSVQWGLGGLRFLVVDPELW